MPDQVKEACEVLSRPGAVIIVPTETVYGLGGDGTNAQAAEKIYAAKGRPSNNPLIIHVHEPAEADKYAYTGDLYFRLAAAFMPGPLTVILPKRECIPYATTGGLDTVAVRCPDHPIAHALLKACGNFPVAAPSANLSGKPSPTVAQHVITDLSGRVDMIIDGGESDIGLESTIVSIDRDHEGEYLTLLRPGAITEEMIAEAMGSVSTDRATLEGLSDDAKVRSPGMKYRHYAPKAPVIAVNGSPRASAQEILKRVTETSGVICFDEFAHLFGSRKIQTLGSAEDKQTQAQRVFDALRYFDSCEDVTEIYAQCPDNQGLGLAIANRLKKAAGFHVIEV